MSAQNKIFGKNTKSESIKFVDYDDYILKGFESIIADNQNFLKILNDFYNEYTNQFSKGDSNLSNYYIDTDMKLPVCLSGISPVEIRNSTHSIFFVVLCSIIPNIHGAEIILTTLNKWSKLLDYYTSDKINHNLNILSFVESWMMYGSDNWYLNPDVFTKTSSKVKEIMKKDYTNYNMSPSSELSYSIFRDIRQDLIEGTPLWINSLSNQDEIELFTKMIEKEERKQKKFA